MSLTPLSAGNDGRHRIAVPDDENAAARHVRATCGAPRRADRPPDTTEGVDAEPAASGAAVSRLRSAGET